MDLLDLINKNDPSFILNYSGFCNQLESIASDNSSSKELNIHDSESRKQSNGHKKAFEFYKEIFPNNRVKENCTINMSVNGSNKTLEYDIVDFDFLFIIEIQGRQHYEVVNFFHKNGANSLLEQVSRDDKKVKWAKDNGWTIIHVPDKVLKNINNSFDFDIKVLKNQEYEQ